MTRTSGQRERAAEPEPIGIAELLHAEGLLPDKHGDFGALNPFSEVITRELSASQLADSVGVPYVELSPDMVSEEALRCLAVSVLEAHNVLPLSLAEGWLTVAMERFTDLDLIDDIAAACGHRVQVIAADGDDIRRTRAAVLQLLDVSEADAADTTSVELDRLLGDLHSEDIQVVEQRDEDDTAELDSAAGSPVIKLVNCIIQSAVEAGASDIHVEPEEHCFRVRNRVDGELADTIRPPARLLPAVVSRIKIIGGMDISERRLPQDGAITLTFAGRSIDLRVSTMATKYGEKVVMRVVDRSTAVLGLDKLGFSADMLRRFRALLNQATGIILVTGPTGSGKTSTLYAGLAEINSPRHNISTIEDPVERRLLGANQFQVHQQAGFTFARALRSLLRQDPDIVMVGEIRDVETAKLATEAALTGHLVLSTLHTNDALTAVPRLVNMGVEPYLVAATLRGVLAQRLVRRVCPHCRKPAPLDPVKREALDQLAGSPCGIEQEYLGAGCAQCRKTGFAGRLGVFELLRLNEELLSAVARQPDMADLRRLTSRHNLTTLVQDGLEKVRNGQITVDGLLEIVTHVDDLADAAPAAA